MYQSNIPLVLIKILNDQSSFKSLYKASSFKSLYKAICIKPFVFSLTLNAHLHVIALEPWGKSKISQVAFDIKESISSLIIFFQKVSFLEFMPSW